MVSPPPPCSHPFVMSFSARPTLITISLLRYLSHHPATHDRSFLVLFFSSRSHGPNQMHVLVCLFSFTYIKKIRRELYIAELMNGWILCTQLSRENKLCRKLQISSLQRHIPWKCYGKSGYHYMW
jgi:hypothetical protein